MNERSDDQQRCRLMGPCAGLQQPAETQGSDAEDALGVFEKVLTDIRRCAVSGLDIAGIYTSFSSQQVLPLLKHVHECLRASYGDSSHTESCILASFCPINASNCTEMGELGLHASLWRLPLDVSAPSEQVGCINGQHLFQVSNLCTV